MTKKKHINADSTTVFLLIALTLAFPKQCALYCRDALSVCADFLIPSVFLFTVLSKFLASLAAEVRFSGKFTVLFSRFFNLPATLVPTCILGLFSSAPSGAIAIGDIYEKGLCTKEEAERASVLANNCSAAFILAMAGTITGSYIYATVILISEILSVLSVYFLLFRDGETTYVKKSMDTTTASFIALLCKSITCSAEISLTICAYVLFFSSFGRAICDLLSALMPSLFSTPLLRGIITSFFEMTTGIGLLGEIQGYGKVPLIGSAVSFCGLSIIFQVTGFLNEKGLSSHHFIFSRFLTLMLTPVIITILLFLLPENICVIAYPTQKTSGGFSTGDAASLTAITVLFIIGAYFISLLDKKHKK